MTASRSLVALLAATAVASTAPAAASAATRVLKDGHTDIAPRMVDGQLRLQVHTDDGAYSDVDDTIFFFSADSLTRIPDNSLLRWGNPGTNVWWLPSGGYPNRLRPGFSNEYVGVPLNEFERPFTLTLESVTGPGGFIVEDGTEPRSVSMGTRGGLPAALSYGVSAHFHTDWVVDKPGVYCLNLRLDAWTAAGEHVRVPQQLTLVTASSVDPDTVVPCADDPAKRAPGPNPQPWPKLATGGTPHVISEPGSDGGWRLLPELDGDALRVPLVRREFAWPGVEQDLRDSVVYSRPDRGLTAYTTRPWEGTPGSEIWQLTRIGWSSARLDPERAPDGPVLHLDGVSGSDGAPAPGTLSAASRARPAEPALSTAPGWQRDSFPLRHDDDPAVTWTASQPGIYCVALHWTARLAGGATVASPTRTLTLVFDDPQARREPDGTLVPLPARFDPTTVRPCERPASERPLTIERGHIDLASRLLGGQLELSIADRSDDGAVSYHDPSGVVLGADPRSELVLPDGFDFLGPAGSSAWVLPQIQQDELLWPGWSTDLIADGALAGGVRWRVTDVRGPGHVAVWSTNALTPVPDVLFSTRRALPQAVEIAQRTHAHANWGFTAPGVYCIDATFDAQRADGAPVSDSVTLTYAVGVDPATATPGACSGRPMPDATPTPTPTPTATPVATPPAIVPDATPPASTPPPAATDPAATPRLRVSGLQAARAIRVASLRSRGLRVRVTAPSAKTRVTARLTLTKATAKRLRLRALTVASGSHRAARVGAVSLRLRPSRAVGARLARARGTVRARLTVTLRTPDGRSATKSMQVTLRTTR